jgi:hypothetical protein
MGQTVIGIMWGVRSPVVVPLVTDEGDGLFDAWASECDDLVKARDAKVWTWATAKPGRAPYQRVNGRDRYVPREVWDAGACGFFVTSLDGLPRLGEWQYPGYAPVEMTRAGVRAAFPKAYRNARARWRRFRAWCSAHRDLPGAEHFATTAPSLWLVPVEVA